MAKVVLPPRFEMPGLSEGAKVILRHFRDQKIAQLEYEYPDTLAGLFADPEDCERAQTELAQLGYIALGPARPAHIPAKSRVRAAAITLEGECYIAKNDL